MKRVVVTGMGALTPIGNTVQEYSASLKAGKSGAARITHFDPTLFKTQFACEVKNFDPRDHLDRKDARKLDNYALYAVAASNEGIADAGLLEGELDMERIGVIWASGIGGLASLEKEVEEYITGSGTPRYNPFMIVKMIANMAAGFISIKNGFRGINYATVTACASSSHAIGNALDHIRLGKADVLVCGGSEAAVTKVGIGGFNAMRALSTRNDDPEGASRPFDADRDGFVLGEGAGCIVLEELEHAKARGARIYAEVMGAAATSDAYHISAPHPEGVGVKRVMRLALEDAGMNLIDIDYVNVHGTSTPLGDVAELNCITDVFGDHAYSMNISSTKSMTGHLLGAAGAIESIACILSMNEGFIPPTINLQTPDAAIDERLNLTPNLAQERQVNAALCNTFGFGGHNSSVVFRKYVE